MVYQEGVIDFNESTELPREVYKSRRELKRPKKYSKFQSYRADKKRKHLGIIFFGSSSSFSSRIIVPKRDHWKR